MSGAELEAFAKMVVRVTTRELARAGRRLDSPEDFEQDAALWTWITYQRSGKPLRRNRTYYMRAARRRALRAMFTRMWPIRMTEHALRVHSAVRAGDLVRLKKTRASAKTAARLAMFDPITERNAA